ncbi:MAG: gamma-glutamyltransferase [Gemmatimonadetes bacterium]|nr:gamma-glutamyltransferase [Gemmatimonadota bacterium]MDA1103013.1 gamma-glutamyltransferase [Gemmatimonadota bacterium]
MTKSVTSLVRHVLGTGLLVVGASACTSAESAQGTWAFPEGWAYSSVVPPITASEGMVVTTDAYASQVGIDILRAGGNAIDAAIAVQFALAVVNPEAGNIGGGGFMVLHTADGQTASLDFREKAPLAASRDMFLDAAGNVTNASVVGHLAAGVPGTVSGMWKAHERFGSRSWTELVAPAIALADGFEVLPRFLGSLSPEMIEALSAYPASAAQFLPREGQPPEVGDTLRQPDLAATLRRIRDQGPDGFYRGVTADLIVDEMKRGKGIMTHEDLASYEALWRDPISFSYRGHTVISMPPSSSGGATMAEIANILSTFELGSLPWHSAEMVHLYAEAWRRAYADRNHYLADPDFIDIPLQRMTSPDYAIERAGTISTTSATSSADVGPGMEGGADESQNTTHFSIVDAEGNAVAVTTTINSWYGSKVTVEGAGFVLNNEMDDFTSKPGTPNQYGLVQGENNSVGPGKRMLSAMTPSIVLDSTGAVRMVTGTPGGATIITTVFQTISNVLDYGMNAVQAVNAPRVHHQHLPDQIYYEPGALDAATVRALEALGHTMVERSGVSGDVQMILVDGGRLTAWSDPRRGGAAIGY